MEESLVESEGVSLATDEGPGVLNVQSLGVDHIRRRILGNQRSGH